MKSKWLHFTIDRENGFGLLCGVVMIVLSLAMALFDSDISNVILRDVLMILLLGFFLPIYYIVVVKKKNLSVLGFHKNKLIVSLLIDVIAAGALLVMFASKSAGEISFDKYSLYAITYIFVAGIFEIVFIYGFLRYEFERAFGILPAVLMTALFYSLHHAGFQPEFIKLFWVGIMYVSVFYLTRNIFSIFPFFWGVGVVWDVLINSGAGNQIKNEASFIIAIIMFIAMIGIVIFVNCKIKRSVKAVRRFS